MSFFSDLKQFILNTYRDERIPRRDKNVILFLIFLIISPFDLIPDWIPFFGQLDDLIMLAMVFNYFFKILDDRILLSHYPWHLKSFARLRAIARALQFLVPTKLMKKKVWKYAPDPF